MRKHLSAHVAATLAGVGVICSSAPVGAQIAGGTTSVEARITESTKLAMGWSVKQTLLGKAIYNDAGDKVGNVEDLIISPDRNVSYVIVGAGGFVGIGQHDVAIPVTRIEDRYGRLVMPGATRDKIKARIDVDVTAVKSDMKTAEAKLGEMKQANVVRWREFEADVSAATSRLRKSVDKALS